MPSTTCATLFTAATPPGGVAPTDTFQAAIDIALNPGNNAATLFGLVTPSAPFQPTLGTAPTDFAVGIQYNGGPIANSGGVFGIDIDASGNAWVTVVARGAVVANVTEISPAGAILSGPTGYLSGSLSTPWGIAIDNSGERLDHQLHTHQQRRSASPLRHRRLLLHSRFRRIPSRNSSRQPHYNNSLDRQLWS